MVTGMPALAKAMAMPPPMVPAPTMAALLTARRLAVGKAGDLAASGARRRRVAQGLGIRAWPGTSLASFSSSAMPWSKGRSTASLQRADRDIGLLGVELLLQPRALAFSRPAMASSSSPAVSTFMSRVRRGPLPSAISCLAKTRPPSRVAVDDGVDEAELPGRRAAGTGAPLKRSFPGSPQRAGQTRGCAGCRRRRA